MTDVTMHPPELRTISEIFEPHEKTDFIIPMYQRNYSWEAPEIQLLIQDIRDACIDNSDANEPKDYYLGTLVVFRHARMTERSELEVIDGQQRLTTLLLLMRALGAYKPNNDRSARLTFECREPSTRALDAILRCPPANQNTEPHSADEGSALWHGAELIKHELTNQHLDDGKLSDYLLNHVKLLCVEMPPSTDVNHYFEVMNNRGEQLEQHEVLKARLLSSLKTDSVSGDIARKQHALNRVWTACSDMTHYIQMNFSTDERNRIFGHNWNDFQPTTFEELLGKMDVGQTPSESGGDLNRLIQLTNEPATPSDLTDKQPRSDRFSSTIDFPNFLLHVLRISIRRQQAETGDKSHNDEDRLKAAKDVPLDDKKIIETFKNALLHGNANARPIEQFTYDLLLCRYLFDTYVIKHESTSDYAGWSLKKCIPEKRSDGTGVGYRNTFGDSDQNNLLMLQSALHVSTPTRPYKYWLTAALNLLITEWDKRSSPESRKIDGGSYYARLYNITRAFVFQRHLSTHEPASYDSLIYGTERDNYRDQTINMDKTRYGNIQNNLIFNFVDYLLWRDGHESLNEAQHKQYRFTQRSSVEHMQPQSPYGGGTQTNWQDTIHSFGNLCLINKDFNSSLSNRGALEKSEKVLNSHISDIPSLKQYLMAKITQDKDGDHPNKWTPAKAEKHGKDMTSILERAKNETVPAT